MPKVIEIIYRLDSGSRVSYTPDDPEQISEEAMSVIIQLVDGKSLDTVVQEGM